MVPSRALDRISRRPPFSRAIAGQAISYALVFAGLKDWELKPIILSDKTFATKNSVDFKEPRGIMQTSRFMPV
jgi:hypothetical protein